MLYHNNVGSANNPSTGIRVSVAWDVKLYYTIPRLAPPGECETLSC